MNQADIVWRGTEVCMIASLADEARRRWIDNGDALAHCDAINAAVDAVVPTDPVVLLAMFHADPLLSRVPLPFATDDVVDAIGVAVWQSVAARLEALISN